MISIDTNVLVRVLVDDAAEADQVRIARDHVSRAGSVFVSQVVQVETVWVLETSYQLKRKTVVSILDHLACNSSFVLEQEELYVEALEMYRREKADFSDYLILAASRRQSCLLLTFDKRLGRSSGVTLIADRKNK